MTVLRIVANIDTPDVGLADQFYRDILKLDLVMDHGWIRTYGGDSKMTVQISVAEHGGSGTETPYLSVEVDDLDVVLEDVRRAGLPIEYGPADEPWGVRRFYVRDPFGKLINVLSHS